MRTISHPVWRCWAPECLPFEPGQATKSSNVSNFQPLNSLQMSHPQSKPIFGEERRSFSLKGIWRQIDAQCRNMPPRLRDDNLGARFRLSLRWSRVPPPPQNHCPMAVSGIEQLLQLGQFIQRVLHLLFLQRGAKAAQEFVDLLFLI